MSATDVGDYSLKRHSLKGGEQYAFLVKGYSGSKYGREENMFYTNVSPYGGSCDVQPKEGKNCHTAFLISINYHWFV